MRHLLPHERHRVLQPAGPATAAPALPQRSRAHVGMLRLHVAVDAGVEVSVDVDVMIDVDTTSTVKFDVKEEAVAASNLRRG